MSLIVGDGKTAKAVSKNVTLKKGKKTKVTLTIKKPAKYKVGSKSKKLKKVTGATVCTVDLVNVLGSFKKVKCSGITVKADGKKVKVKKVYQDLSRRTNLLARTTGDYLSTTSGVIRVTTLRQTMLKHLHSRRILRSLSQLLLNN